MEKPRILITDKIHESGIAEARKFADVDVHLKCPPEELVKKIPDYDALIVRSETKVTKEVIAAAKRLKIVGRAGVGLDNIDVKAVKEKGIEIVNSPECSTISVAEHAIGLMLAFLRKIPAGEKHLREGKWERSKYQGNELYGKTLGVVGLGRIGREVALRARAFGMRVLGYDTNMTMEDMEEYNVEYVGELPDLLKQSDIVSVHVPLTDATRNMISEKEIGLMKKTAIIINTARGGVINENALYNALREGRIKGAGLDVFENEPPAGSPLLTLENVVLTPHLASGTEEAQIKAGTIVVEKIKNFFRGK